MKKSVIALMTAATLVTAGLTSYADVISDVPSQVDSSQSTGTAAPQSTASSGSTGTSSTGTNSTASGSSSASGTTSVVIGASASSSAPPTSSTSGSSTQTSAEDIAVNVGNGETVIVDVPGSAPDLPSVKVIGSGSSTSTGSGSIITAPGQAASDLSGSEVGSMYSSDSKVKVELGYTLVSPNVDYNGFKVAEGSVQLKDGSWASIGHDKYIRQPYFKLLREEGDWYVVSVNAKRIGNYTTPDGSTITELWLKKSDCVARNYIELNTTSAKRQAIVKYALSLLGKGYQYAGNGPDVFDCSGFVNHVMSTNGIKVARNSTAICQNGSEVGINGLRPGDIVGRSGHVGIYIGDGCFVHAAESSTGVITDSVAIYNRSSAFTSYRNVAGD